MKTCMYFCMHIERNLLNIYFSKNVSKSLESIEKYMNLGSVGDSRIKYQPWT
jgi:hypothetical protein